MFMFIKLNPMDFVWLLTLIKMKKEKEMIEQNVFDWFKKLQTQAFKSNNYDNQFFICHLSCAFNYQKVKVQVYVNTLRLEMTMKRRTVIIGSYEKPFKCILAANTHLISYWTIT